VEVEARLRSLSRPGRMARMAIAVFGRAKPNSSASITEPRETEDVMGSDVVPAKQAATIWQIRDYVGQASRRYRRRVLRPKRVGPLALPAAEPT